jgi:hypothetical protein
LLLLLLRLLPQTCLLLLPPQLVPFLPQAATPHL